MKPAIQKRLSFAAKSMMWSVLLYAVFMLVVNWDDVSNKIRGVNPITVISSLSAGQSTIVHPAAKPTSISLGGIVTSDAAAILNAISNIVALIR